MDKAVSTDPSSLMRSILQRIATGPELSKDISFEEARDGMRAILDGSVDPVQAGIFLIALRMKRETDDENRGVLQAMLDVTEHHVAEVDDVVDIADPYDGYLRGLPVTPFLPAVIAACGVRAVSHGVETMGPKYGATHRKVLRAAGIDVDLSVRDALLRISDPAIGWSYIDQSRFCPSLYALSALRTLIVKRPCITTTEVMLRPVSGRRATHLVTGYVHKPYPPIYSMLARHAGFGSALIVRGVEGGVMPSLQQPAKAFRYEAPDVPDEEWRITPEMAGIVDAAERAPALPAETPSAGETGPALVDAIAASAANAGIQALHGTRGSFRNGLVYAGGLILAHLKRHESVPDAAAEIERVLDDGSAWTRFSRF